MSDRLTLLVSEPRRDWQWMKPTDERSRFLKNKSGSSIAKELQCWIGWKIGDRENEKSSSSLVFVIPDNAIKQEGVEFDITHSSDH